MGDPGAGFRQMADMVNNSRLSNGVRAAGLMRRAVFEAVFVARRRVAFGTHLVDMPLMRRQLAKMAMRAATSPTRSTKRWRWRACAGRGASRRSRPWRR